MAKKRTAKVYYRLGLHYENGETENIFIGLDLQKCEQIIQETPKGTTIELFYSKGENSKKYHTLNTINK
jgi:hypothetical protein